LPILQLFEGDNPRGVNPEHVRKIRQILATLNEATRIEGMNLPSFRLHPLAGNLGGLWSVNLKAIIYLIAGKLQFDLPT
jgi:proteic killer suppression protein